AVMNRHKARFEFRHNSAVSLAGAWASALAWRGLSSPREALEKLLALTPADVNRVARKYFQREHRIKVVLPPSADGNRPPQSRGFGGTEKFASNAKLNVPLPEWAKKALDQLEMPHWWLDPVTLELKNGITLIVEPESVSSTVTLYGKVRSNPDLQAPE